MTRLTQRDACSQNVVKSPGYCIKQIDFFLLWVCTLITHRGHQNMVRTSVTLRAVLLCSYHVLTSSVRYQSTDVQQNEIYLLNNMISELIILQRDGEIPVVPFLLLKNTLTCLLLVVSDRISTSTTIIICNKKFLSFFQPSLDVHLPTCRQACICCCRLHISRQD